ncbi:hypothetical protein F5882DRAFT_507724 [Hyaloscypha sp. PMI_1271]|nr:hypothetical protein F5882DRAFT_507724 [Hyaloscypha sp. PMI_1271]
MAAGGDCHVTLFQNQTTSTMSRLPIRTPSNGARARVLLARLLKAGIRGDGALFAQTMLRRLTRNSQLQGCRMACFELLLFRPNSKFRSRSCAGAADSPHWHSTNNRADEEAPGPGQVRAAERGYWSVTGVAARGSPRPIAAQHSTAHPFVLQEQNSARFQEFGSFKEVGDPASCFRDFGLQQAALPHPFEDVTGCVKERDPPSGVSER